MAVVLSVMIIIIMPNKIRPFREFLLAYVAYNDLVAEFMEILIVLLNGALVGETVFPSFPGTTVHYRQNQNPLRS